MKLCIVTLAMAVAGVRGEGAPCADWFAVSESNVCPAANPHQRDAYDYRPVAGEFSSSGERLSEEEDFQGQCCFTKCSDAGGTCATGTVFNGEVRLYGHEDTGDEEIEECCEITCALAAKATCEDDEMLNDRKCMLTFAGPPNGTEPGEEEERDMCAQAERSGEFVGCCEKATCMNDPSNEAYPGEECGSIDDWFDEVCGKNTETCEVLCDVGPDDLNQEFLQACADCASQNNPLCFGCLTCLIETSDLTGLAPFDDNTPTTEDEAPEFSGADKAAAASGSVVLLSAVLTAMF